MCWKLLKHLCVLPDKISYKIVERRPGDLPTSYADPSKANEELKWQATRTLDEMCDDAWRWQSQNPNGYEGLSFHLKDGIRECFGVERQNTPLLLKPHLYILALLEPWIGRTTDGYYILCRQGCSKVFVSEYSQ